MQGMDLHGLVRDAIKRRPGTKKSGDKLAFRCVRHSDSQASAWMGDHAWGCSACGFSEPLRSLAEALGIDVPATAGRGLTMEEYAERKGLSIATLTAAGVRTEMGKYGDPLVAVPYYNADGQLLRTKYRTRTGTFWAKDGVGTPMYGLDRLALTPKDVPVLIVEGESDCHAAWQRGVCAVGLPGASQWKPEYAEHLMGRQVLVWQEPDEGGATLVASVMRSFPKATVLREVKIGETLVKDLCDLHQLVQAEGGDWTAVWRDVLEQSTPAGAEGPVMAFDVVGGETLEAMLAEKLAPIEAVPTPIPAWNALCRGAGGGVGLARSWMVTIGANTGTGKSLVALNLAAEAIRHGEVVTFLSLEMGRSELATRLLSIVSGVPVLSLEQGTQFDQEAYLRASVAVDSIRRETGGYVQVNRRPMSKLSDVVQSMRHYHETTGSRYFLVDYLQLAWTQSTHSITERTELVAHQLRELSHTLGVTLVALSQFNRSTSANRAERPVAQGLMGGSAIENDSHQVLLLDHSRWERRGDEADTWLIVDKNRHGGVQDIPVRWEYRTLRLVPRVPTAEESEKIHGRATRLMGRLT
jgi:KaiC/GvpD/RAD55 family RecA-like ATPase